MCNTEFFTYPKSHADCRRHETSSKGAKYWGEGGSCTPEKFLNLKSLKCHFLDFGRRFYTILVVRKQHYKIKLYIIILHSKLYSVCPSKYQDHSKPLKHLPINIWSATNTFIWLYCCDVTKTTVNEIRNLSKMADISLLQVKIFQELSKI